jgi:DNA-binding transcriptional regulator YhcF (GntR family)
MKIWLSKNSEVSIHDQITTQIVLGVASGDLSIGQKLPGTREIARRYNVHANTVANAYRKLAAQGWLEFKKGSGFYVCEAQTGTIENSLDRLIAEFFQKARNEGFSTSEIKEKLTQFFATESADEITLIESDLEFRKILAEEIKKVINLKVNETSFEDFDKDLRDGNSIFVAMFDEKPRIESVLSSDKKCLFLKLRSVSDSMKDQQRPSSEDLIAVVSGWEKFLLLSKTMLVAAQIDAENLIIRNTNEDNWKNGLSSAAMIICDSLTAKKIAGFQNIRIFHLIADESIEQLKQFG